MAANGVNSDDYARRKRRPPQNDQATEHEPTEQPEGEVATSLSSDALNDARISGRGNSPARAALLQRMQQGYGNRASQRFVQRTGTTGAPVQRRPKAPAKKPAGAAPFVPSEFAPPAGVLENHHLPTVGATVESVEAAFLRNRVIAGADWPYVKSDPTWRGWSEITALLSPETLAAQLKNMRREVGVNHVLTPYDFGAGTFSADIEIFASIQSFKFVRADGGKTSIGQQSNTGVSGTSAITNGTTAGATASAGKDGEGSAGLNASTNSSTTAGGTVTLGGQTSTSTELDGTCVFDLNITFTVMIRQKIKIGTVSNILSLGVGGLVAAAKENPLQKVTFDGSARVRFPKAECTPMG